MVPYLKCLNKNRGNQEAADAAERALTNIIKCILEGFRVSGLGFGSES